MPRILVVEDHPTMREAVRLMLEPEGFAVTEVADGNDALRSVREDPPDVLLLDLGIPGKGGADVLAELKADPATAAVPVIVVTATGIETREEILALGAAAFFPKPFSPVALLRTVATVLGGRDGAGSTP